MAEAGAAGAVAVHESALWRWAAAARRLPPPSMFIECARGERGRAAAFDLEACAFRRPPAAAGDVAAAAPESGARRLRRSASFA
jgi:hypothetical protein